MTDPLARFRRPGTAPSETQASAAAKPEGGKEPYVAFTSKDRVRAIDIFCKDGSAHSATFSYLLYASWDWRNHDHFFLLFSFLMVKITGRNLQEVVQALRLRKCETLREFDGTLHQEPDPDAPLITSIEVVTGQAPATYRNTEARGR